jgi:hypothetical protein
MCSDSDTFSLSQSLRGALTHCVQQLVHAIPGLASLALGIATLALAATSVATAQAPATVGLATFGPLDPADRFPLFYEDRNGLRLQLCRTPAMCLYALPNPAAPMVFPTNYSGEQFYYHVGTSGTGIAGALLLYEHALEATFLNGTPVDGDQMVFSRFRLRITGLLDGASYTVTHPYGTNTYVAGADARLPGEINVTVDIGATPLSFALALAGNVGPFLVPLGYRAGLPGTFIGDAVTEGPVQGSPFGTNFLRVDGPSIGFAFPANAINNNSIQLNNFSLQGQLATAGGVGITKAYVSSSTIPAQTAVEVWAQAASGSSIQAEAPGSTPVLMQEIGATGKFFARVVMPAGSPNPTSVTVTSISDVPPRSVTQNGLTDAVASHNTVFIVGGDLYVSASSSDKVGSPILTVTGNGFAPMALTGAGNGIANGHMGLTPGAPPPESVTITSASGGTITVPVMVEAAEPVTANAGLDQAVAAGATVSISGALSTGPIASYAWTQVSGPTVFLNGANSASASFTAPTPLTAQQVVLNLRVTGTFGQNSVDTVIINVAAVPPVLANAGADLNVAGGANVLVSAAASSGPITGYSWSANDPGLVITGANTASASFTAPSLITGAVLTLTLTVTGAFGQTSSDTVLVNVGPAVPVGVVLANAGADQSVAAGAPVALTGAASLGAVTTYAWSHDAGTAIALVGANTVSPSFTAPASLTASVITFTLTVSNGLGATSTDTVVIQVAAMTPVFANAGVDQTTTSGSRVTLNAVNSTGPISTYAWAQTGGPATALTGANTSAASFTAPVVTTATVLTFSLTVRSALGATSTDLIAIQVTPVQDLVTVTLAQFTVGTASWRLQGTTAQRLGQSVTIYLGAVGDTTKPIGTVVVPTTGRWQLQTARNSGPTPTTQTTVWAASSLGGTPGSLTFTRG